MAKVETAARVQRATLLSVEHAHFMAWLEEKRKQELYEEFEEDLHAEQAEGGVPRCPRERPSQILENI